MDAVRIGRVIRSLRLRLGLTQEELRRRARVTRRAVSMAEVGLIHRLRLEQVDAIVAGLGARLDYRIWWNGPELDRLLDAAHASLVAVSKDQLERWGWLVRVEMSYSQFGERGRIDLVAFHPLARSLLVIEVKTDLVDVQALLGAVDVKVRLAPRIVAPLGWKPRVVIPAIVFAEDKTVRRRLTEFGTLFDRFSLRGRACVAWLRSPAPPAGSEAAPAPTGLLWFTSRSVAPQVRIAGQRVRRKRARRSAPSAEPARGAPAAGRIG